jgi:hypothetical protein
MHIYIMFTQKLDKYNNKLSNYIGGADGNINITIHYIGTGGTVKYKEPHTLVISKNYTGLMLKQKIFELDSRLNIKYQRLVHDRTHREIINDKIPEWMEGDKINVVINVPTPLISLAELNRTVKY